MAEFDVPAKFIFTAMNAKDVALLMIHRHMSLLFVQIYNMSKVGNIFFRYV